MYLDHQCFLIACSAKLSVSSVHRYDNSARESYTPIAALGEEAQLETEQPMEGQMDEDVGNSDGFYIFRHSRRAGHSSRC